ncbi:MAG: PilZ domain-containing protein [Myxococcota bacterium]|nr:PilZ domain-containing protein [Myxococcota bacterium]
MSEKRRDYRVKTEFETLYSSTKKYGAGMLADISYSGALIEGVSDKPPLGSELRLLVFLRPVSPFELVGEVVRHTTDGFAVEYKDLDPEVRRLVDDASAVVQS